MATRPVTVNGLGMSSGAAMANIRRFQMRASMIGEKEASSERLLRWAGQTGITGKRLHDVQLLATAEAAGLGYLLTTNAADFPGVSTVQVVPLHVLEFRL